MEKKYDELKKKVKYAQYQAQNHVQKTRLKHIVDGNLEDQIKL